MSYKHADHLATPIIGYTHHGLYVGGGFVVEKSRNGVNLATLDEFSEDHEIRVVHHARKRKFTRDESVNRAYSRLGEDKYNVIFDNCEHFVNWCIFGIATSKQVQDAVMASCMVAAHMCDRSVPDVVQKYLANNPKVLEIVAQRAGSIPATSVLAKALQSLGVVDGAGAAIKAALPGLGLGACAAVTASTAASTSATASVVAGGVAGIGAAAGTALAGGAVTGMTTGFVAGVGAATAATTLATVAAPLVIGVGVATAIWSFFDD